MRRWRPAGRCQRSSTRVTKSPWNSFSPARFGFSTSRGRCGGRWTGPDRGGYSGCGWARSSPGRSGSGELMSTNLIAAIIAFGIMIFAHELGHFLVAKRVGITVHAFAVGFGPKLVGVTRGETVYAINLVPFGGYVKLAGEELEDSGGARTGLAPAPWERMGGPAAGPPVNFLLGPFLLSWVGLLLGGPPRGANPLRQPLPDLR